MVEKWTVRKIFGPKDKKDGRNLIVDKNAYGGIFNIILHHKLFR
jgi:hypothetical protein